MRILVKAGGAERSVFARGTETVGWLLGKATAAFALEAPLERLALPDGTPLDPADVLVDALATSTTVVAALPDGGGGVGVGVGVPAGPAAGAGTSAANPDKGVKVGSRLAPEDADAGVEEGKADGGTSVCLRAVNGQQFRVPLGEGAMWYSVTVAALAKVGAGVPPPVLEQLRAVLYNADGSPLFADDKQLLEKVADWRVAPGEVFHVHLVPSAAPMPPACPGLDPAVGGDTVSVKGLSGATVAIRCNLSHDTVYTLKRKVQSAEHIPVAVQKLVLSGAVLNNNDVLADVGVVPDSLLFVSVGIKGHPTSSTGGWRGNFSASTTPTRVPQTDAGRAIFFSTLYVVAEKLIGDATTARKVVSTVRMLSGNPPLVAALHALTKRKLLGRDQRHALVEGLWRLFRQIVPPTAADAIPDGVESGDESLFEHSRAAWAYLLHHATRVEYTPAEEFEAVSLSCAVGHTRLVEPVRVPGVDKPLSLASVEAAVESGTAVPGCTKVPLTLADARPDAAAARRLKSHTGTEAWVWSLALAAKEAAKQEAAQAVATEAAAAAEGGSTAPAGPPPTSPAFQAFDVADFTEEWAVFADRPDDDDYAELHVAAALRLRSVTLRPPALTTNADRRLCVFVERGGCWSVGDDVVVLDVLQGKTSSVNPNTLAATLGGGDYRAAAAESTRMKAGGLPPTEGVINDPPDEALCVLLDVSTSMTLPAWPPEEDTSVPPEGTTRVRISTLLTQLVLELPSTATIAQLRAAVHDNHGIPIDADVIYRGDDLEDATTLAEAGVFTGGPPIFINTAEGNPPLQPMSRLDAVKQLFHALSNRTMAYQFTHVIGLQTFGSEVKQACGMTELFVVFKAHVDAAKASGQTALYDALDAAREELAKLGKDHPGCIRRVICLTDGEDSCSECDPAVVAASLQADGVVVDSVLVGSRNPTLHAISVATGGAAFTPTSVTDGMRLFEQEALLSLRTRVRKPPAPRVRNVASLMGLVDGVAFDTDLPNVAPKELGDKVAPAASIVKLPTPPPAPSHTARQTQRIMRELALTLKTPHAYMEVYPSEANISFWQILCRGPEGTPYEGGVWLLYLSFPETYPLAPPTLRFVTPIYHCNCSASGRVCHSVFGRDFSSDLTVVTLLAAAWGLLLTPEPDDPLDSTMAEAFFADRAAYDATARTFTQRHAATSMHDWRVKLVGEAAAAELRGGEEGAAGEGGSGSSL